MTASRRVIIATSFARNESYFIIFITVMSYHQSSTFSNQASQQRDIVNYSGLNIQISFTKRVLETFKSYK